MAPLIVAQSSESAVGLDVRWVKPERYLVARGGLVLAFQFGERTRHVGMEPGRARGAGDGRLIPSKGVAPFALSLEHLAHVVPGHGLIRVQPDRAFDNRPWLRRAAPVRGGRYPGC